MSWLRRFSSGGLFWEIADEPTMAEARYGLGRYFEFYIISDFARHWTTAPQPRCMAKRGLPFVVLTKRGATWGTYTRPALLALFAARFSSNVLCGFFFVSFLVSRLLDINFPFLYYAALYSAGDFTA
ncbi:MAG: hypothetical protein ABSB11_09845 [Sedimentisphaerales bacterium]|jgi:hypothetical protein